MGKAAEASRLRREKEAKEKALSESVTGRFESYDVTPTGETKTGERYFYKGKEIYPPASKGKNLATAQVQLATGETVAGKVIVSPQERASIQQADAARARVLAGRQARGETSTFTGKFEESYQGKPTATKYYVQGQETARVVQTSRGPMADVKQPSRIQFEKESVEVTKEGVTTARQQEPIAEREYPEETKSRALAAIPGQYFGTIFHKQLSPELLEEAQTGSVVGNLIKFWDPRFQYDVALYNEQLRYDIQEVEKLNQNVVSSKERLISSGIPEAELESGTITSPLSSEQEQSLNEYNQYVTQMMSSPATQKVFSNQGDLYQVIAGSSLSNVNKGIGSGLARGAETLGYLAPPSRVVLGLDVAIEGGKTIEFAKTGTQKALGGVQIGIGTLMAYTGARTTQGLVGTVPSTTGLVIPTTHTTLVKVGAYGIGTLAIGGIGTLDYYMTYKKTGSKAVALGSALGSSGVLLAGIYGPPIIEGAQDWWATRRGMKELKTPGMGEKPFIRATISGRKQLVFYERAQQVKWYNPKTWKYYGTKPGQFYQREYRLIDPRVEAHIQRTGKVTYYDVVNGKVVQGTTSTSPLPKDLPSTHKQWFTQTKGGVQQYYIPQKYLPRYITSGTEARGFSASPQQWQEGIKELEKYQVYYSGKGASPYFFRIGGEKATIAIGGAGETGPKPYLYESYFKSAYPTSAVKEVVVPNPLGGEKGWKQYILTSQGPSGSINIPGFKMEVEGVVTGPRTGLGASYWFTFSGRRIPIESGAYGFSGESVSVPSAASLLTDKSGTLFPATGASTSSYSYIPSTQYVSSVVVPGTILYNPPSTTKVKYSTINYSYTPISSSIIPPSIIYSPTPSPRHGGGSSYVSPVSSSVVIPLRSYVSPVPSYLPKSSYKIPETPSSIKITPYAKSFRLPSVKQAKAYGKFPAFLRRFGKFKIVGYGETPAQAVRVGKKAAQYTLGATFKVPSFKGTKVPGFKTKKSKEGVLFIEPRGQRLKKRGISKEVSEIEFFRKLKRRK